MSFGPHTRNKGFQTTVWTRVENSAGDGELISSLFEDFYYEPLYSYLRLQKGFNRDEALHGLHGFFEKIQKSGSFGRAKRTREKKFRSYLIRALDNFLISEWKKSDALKRGGDAEHLSLDIEDIEQELDIKSDSSPVDPERYFDQRLAMNIMDRAFERLEEDYAKKSDSLFSELKPFLLENSRDTGGYVSAALRAGMNEASFRKAVSRFRESFGDHVRAAMSDIVPRDRVSEELRALGQSLSSN